MAQADLADYNHILFRCNEEELDSSCGKRGTYQLSDRKLEYAGLMSIVHICEQQQIRSDMGHPLFDNMRQGDWLFDYTVDRLRQAGTKLHEFAEFCAHRFELVKQVPLNLKPKYAT